MLSILSDLQMMKTAYNKEHGEVLFSLEFVLFVIYSLWYTG